jgi:hypothetical protein
MPIGCMSNTIFSCFYDLQSEEKTTISPRRVTASMFPLEVRWTLWEGARTYCSRLRNGGFFLSSERGFFEPGFRLTVNRAYNEGLAKARATGAEMEYNRFTLGQYLKK